MISHHELTLQAYLDKLGAREPVPGGGSAAAISSAMGAGLMEMVSRYSLGKGKEASIEARIAEVLEKAGKDRQRFLELSTLDSKAYLALREAKKLSPEAYQQALKDAAAVPQEIKTLSEAALGVIPFLKTEGNKYLLSDVIAAEAFLKAGRDAAQAMIETNT